MTLTLVQHVCLKVLSYNSDYMIVQSYLDLKIDCETSSCNITLINYSRVSFLELSYEEYCGHDPMYGSNSQPLGWEADTLTTQQQLPF